ncbi:tetratricopeptide repeat protein [Fimbriiglobus ruber]|uniref:Uncharacterized protein n=1 Tax=Fimbriiglobus ruber TaxID=1908690 RepID=A0A225DWS4_9BACT|nr:tetratricopeptide repeat protein [Fimbriiglobus ruber]OWK40617.1 hypothetical protein FRUB_05536 [Fimbriiglobus ruber]
MEKISVGIGLIIVTCVVVLMAGFVAAAWFLLRPLAVSLGLVRLTPYDYMVQAWKAERAGRWEDALAAYDQALRLDPSDQDTHARRNTVLEHLSDLDE